VSRHTFHAMHQGRRVEIAAGWDRPLQGFFMTIEYPMDTAGDGDDYEWLFNNLELAVPHPTRFGTFADRLRELAIPLHDDILRAILSDAENDRGNLNLNWDQSRHKCACCGNKAVQRQYLVWGREDLDNDSEAFDLVGARPNEAHDKYWCNRCQRLVPAAPYPVPTNEAGDIVDLSER